MKVLLVSPLPPPVGGIATVTTNMISYFELENQEINLILCNTSNNLKSITSQSLILRLLTGSYKSIEIYFRVKKIIREEKPQVIHLSSSSSIALLKDWLIIRLAKKFNIPVIMHWHFGRIPQLSIKRNWEWKLLCHLIHKSTWSIVLDTKSYRILSSLGFINISNIPNPLALDNENQSRKLLGKYNPREQDRLIFVGHIVRSKGIYELVEACALIPSVKELILVGPYEEVVQKELLIMANKRGNGVWLKLTGKLDKDHVLKLMVNAPFLVLPSYTEGFPLVIVEAMAMGCAIIATDVGAIPEMLDIYSDKPCGICVPAKNTDKLREAIITLMNDHLKAETMGKNGNERVLNNYTMGKVVEQYKSIWTEAAKK